MTSIDKMIKKNIVLAEHSSYEIGGQVAYFVMPASFQDLRKILEYVQRVGQPYFYFGVGSNLLFPDSPHPDTLYISLQRLMELEVKSQDCGYKIHLHAGTPMAYLAQIGLAYGIEELYFTHLLPGTIGAGIYINAKCYDDQICDILDYVYYIDADNPGAGIHKVPASACSFAYKKSIFQTRNWIICGADLRVLHSKNTTTNCVPDGEEIYELDVDQTLAEIYQSPGRNIIRLGDFYKYFQGNISSPLYIPKKFELIDADRSAKHHFSYPSCGSVFKNNYDHGEPMGTVIDKLGLKGKEHGGAMISPHHGNFIINHKQATAQDVKYLIDYVQEQVEREHGFVPEPEVVLVK